MSEDFFDRLDKYMVYSGLNDNKLTIAASLSIGALGKQRKGSRGLSGDSIAKILYACPDLSGDWLLTGQGEMLKSKNTTIFKTKTPENALNKNEGNFEGGFEGKRKFRKTPSNKQYKITGSTPPIVADPPTPYLDSQPQQGKGRIIDSSYLEIEIPPERRGIRNMFSGFTDEEIEKAMSEEFVNNVLEMFKTGEAVSPSTMKDTINEIVKQKDAEINELRAKLWQYESTFGSISPGDNKPPALHVDNSDKRNPDK